MCIALTAYISLIFFFILPWNKLRIKLRGWNYIRPIINIGSRDLNCHQTVEQGLSKAYALFFTCLYVSGNYHSPQFYSLYLNVRWRGLVDVICVVGIYVVLVLKVHAIHSLEFVGHVEWWHPWSIWRVTTNHLKFTCAMQVTFCCICLSRKEF